MSGKPELILVSDCIYTAAGNAPFCGYVAVENGIITAAAEGTVPPEMIGKDTRVLELGSRTVTPGFIDVHCFFTGYVVRFLGADLSGCGNAEEVISMLNDCAKQLPGHYPLLGHGLRFAIPADVLDKAYEKRPTVLFVEGCESCAMNTAAVEAYHFDPEHCWPEAYVAIFPYILGDKEFIRPQFIEYMKMMNSHGVTSVKEMGFDDFYGFDEVLSELEAEDALTLRVNFMSQPVAREIDFEYGERMRDRFQGAKVSFSGYNQMTDGSVSEYKAELKRPYNGTDSCCEEKIDWQKLEDWTLEADHRGFRFSLHAQGDGAVARTLDIYEKCGRDENGKVLLRQAITDLEFTDPTDLERMGRLGVIAEIYPQIQSIAQRDSKLAMIREKIGEERGAFYWNRRKMADSGVTISCGTDLPLLIDDIPQSVYHAVGGYFPEGGEPFNLKNMLTRRELVDAWTRGGAWNLGKEDSLGTLETGKKADIAVLSGDLFTVPLEEIRDLKVCLTVCDGKIVYEGDNL